MLFSCYWRRAYVGLALVVCTLQPCSDKFGYPFLKGHLKGLYLNIDINNQGQDIKDIRRVGNWDLGVTEHQYTKQITK